MEINTEIKNNKNTFFSHVFSTTDEDKAEMLNVIQYALIAVIPVVILNKTVQRFIPEADPDKSSIELLVEVVIQLALILIGIILIHRIISFIPTYSGFKYENLTLTNIILGFLVIIFSIQSKIGMKANILVDRINILWNGPIENMEDEQPVRKKKTRRSAHTPSQADTLDNPALQNDLFPPAPIATSRGGNDTLQIDESPFGGPLAANSVLGSSFGTNF